MDIEETDIQFTYLIGAPGCTVNIRRIDINGINGARTRVFLRLQRKLINDCLILNFTTVAVG